MERGTASQENTDYHAIIIHAEALCFHGKQRCVTCKAIEKYTQEVVNADLVKNGKLRFKEVDISCRDIVFGSCNCAGVFVNYIAKWAIWCKKIQKSAALRFFSDLCCTSVNLASAIKLQLIVLQFSGTL